MRALILLMVLAPAAAAQDDLMPREGSGWSGFKPGTWVRLKHTYARKGGVPSVTLTRMELKSIDDGILTLATTSENALRVAGQKSVTKLPLKGEAAQGEKAKVEKLGNEAVFACGKKFECEKRRTTVTSPAGRRVITEWISPKPRMRVKRTEEHYDAVGKKSTQVVLLLTELAKEREVGKGKVKVKCLTYSMMREEGPVRYRGTAVVSRDVPSYNVRMDTEVTQGGKLVWNVRIEVLEFGIK